MCEGTVYVSKKPLESYEVTKIVRDLVKRYPWLNKCMRDCRQANIGRQHSLNYIFRKNAKVPTREELNASKDPHSAKKRSTGPKKKTPDQMKLLNFFERCNGNGSIGENYGRRNTIDENQIEMVVVERPNEKGPAELVISPKLPEKAVKTKDNVSSFITQNLLDAGEQLLEMEKGGRVKKQIRTKVTFSYEGIDILTKKEFTLFDQEVHDAVVTLFKAGNHFITSAMVYRAMTGKTNSEYIHPDKLKEIEESIDKCMFSKLVIDATEEAAYYGFEEAKYDGSLLSAEKMTIKMGGRRVAAYKILVEPLLYRYAKAGKQISAIDIKLLDTPVSKTNDIIVLQGFLLRKIEAMKSDRTADRIILYDDIYKIFGINEPQKVKNQLQRIRKYMDTMLEYWKGEKYITDFIVNKKGKSYYSVTIYI